MKRKLKILLIAALAVILSCAFVFADDPEVDGVYNITTSAAVEIHPQTSGADIGSYIAVSTAAISSDSTIEGSAYDGDFYEAAEKLELIYKGAEDGKYYLIIAQDTDSSVPSVSAITYIDQATASGGAVRFTVYPKYLSSDSHNYIYMSSNAYEGITAYQQIGMFDYYQSYLLGDANNDGKVNVTDALRALKIAVELYKDYTVKEYKASDVIADGIVKSADALKILKYAVELIFTWD